jgi:tRNA-splicing ligase RtcB
MIRVQEANLTVFGPMDDIEDGNFYKNSPVYQQIRACLDAVDGSFGALMADKHKGYRMPIGGVVAYPRHISPTGVGYDIGCGNYAVRTSLRPRDLGDIDNLVTKIREKIVFGIGTTSPLHKGEIEILGIDWKNPLMKDLKQLAASQLGTIGGGNHYVDIMNDKDQNVWVACHFGSRGFGHKIARKTMEILGFKDTMDGPPALLEENTPLFDDYLEAMCFAGMYATLGRKMVVEYILDILGAKPVEMISNHHNFAWSEIIQGEHYWVIRKGATPLWDKPIFIGGSMGDISAIVEPIPGTTEMYASLNSAPHGAGRTMSRSQAKKLINMQDVNVYLEKMGVHLYGGGADEAPNAYRGLSTVLGYHENLRIRTRLWPIVVMMAGKGEEDPYKD